MEVFVRAWRVQVASLGAYLDARGVIAMSFAPRDSHEAQVQFALERPTFPSHRFNFNQTFNFDVN